MRSTRLGLSVLAASVVLLAWASSSGDPPPQTGPATEKRFPPLQVPPGFKATLFACDPLIEYPSAIAAGPRPAALFVAVDYMTGLGTEIVRRSEIRLIEDVDGDGYADRSTVYAGEFNSIEGMTYHDGTVYVMHAPFLTALRDTNGDGKADERRDLLTGLGLTPEQNPVRLHCANGCVMGHDGWLYLALGDHGCDVKRPEGDRLVLEGGGILRCRPNGRDAHVFATGLRNIYDVALDEDLDVFVRDNENDGGDYKVRVCHSFFAADHGYPYLYYERPDEALPPLADLGLGSSAGGLCYLEQAFPAEFRGNLFFCEWGRAVMRYRPQRAGSSFAPLKEILFAAGAENDPYGFKPTDLAVQSDGALFVADWADGQRPKRGRGRIYRITAKEEAKSVPSPDSKPADGDSPALLAQLDSPSYHKRCEAQRALERQGQKATAALREALVKGHLGAVGRLHAVWSLAHVEGPSANADLLDLARSDREPRVRAQAVRAVADLADPVLAKHRLDAGAGNVELAKRLAAIAKDQAPQVVREIIVAVGRLRWADAPAWLRETLRTNEPAISHAAMQALRQSGNWPAVLRLLDEPDSLPVRAVALRAIADRHDHVVADGLIERLRREQAASRRREYADLLTRIYQRPVAWTYWGYRPPPRPANTVAWERTEAIGQALDRALADQDREVRLAVLRRMQREKIPTRLATLSQWLRDERQTDCVAVLLEALRNHPAADVRGILAVGVAQREHTVANRLAALALLIGGLDPASQTKLAELASSLEDGPVLAAVLAALAQRPELKPSPLLLGKLSSADAAVRAAAMEALGTLRVAEAADRVGPLLADKDPRVRVAAATVAGKLAVRPATEPLLRLARDTEPAVRRASLEALRLLKEPRAVPLAVAALADRETRPAALQCIAELGGPAQAGAVVEVATRDPSSEVLSQVIGMLSKWSQDAKIPLAQRLEARRAVDQVQGASGALLRWTVAGPLVASEAKTLIERWSAAPASSAEGPQAASPWRTLPATSAEGRVVLGAKPATEGEALFLAYTDLAIAEPTNTQFLGGSSGAWRVWLNGKLVHQRDSAGAFQPDGERFDASLAKGGSRLLVQVAGGKPEFQLRFRRKSSSADQERLAQAALTRPGNADRGRQVFMDAEKSQCLKCHRLGDKGERIGPELTGLGGRFSRMHVIESLLEPSRAIAPSFQTVSLLLDDGRVLTGLVLSDQDGTLTLADNQGRKQALAKSAIQKQQPSPLSTMPDGLEKRLTAEEFVDLVAFLAAQKAAQ
jgi:putative membrane-bound dehydrogenase-like protein